jgi:hypothetical protein
MTCIHVGLLKSFKVLFLSCSIVVWWGTANCCCMGDLCLMVCWLYQMCSGPGGGRSSGIGENVGQECLFFFKLSSSLPLN